MQSTIRSISFIIPAFNCEGTLRETVDSIYEGNFEPGDEIIIVNDASTDGTVRLVEELQKTHPEIKLLEHHINKGTAAAARNTGIDASKNELLFALDSDNVLVPESISKLKKYLLEQNADAAAFGELHFFSNTPKETTHQWVFKSEITFADCLHEQKNPLWSGNYLFTKTSWKKAGRYFEPNLVNQTIDSWAFGIRQLGRGAKFVTLPGTFYHHRYGHESHYMREHKNGNTSLAALSVILPFLDQIKQKDVDYIFSPAHRLSWFKKLEKHPLRLKTDSERKQEEIRQRMKEKSTNMLRRIYSPLKKIIRKK